jgi:hypothetical protein
MLVSKSLKRRSVHSTASRPDLVRADLGLAIRRARDGDEQPLPLRNEEGRASGGTGRDVGHRLVVVSVDLPVDVDEPLPPEA